MNLNQNPHAGLAPSLLPTLSAKLSKNLEAITLSTYDFSAIHKNHPLNLLITFFWQLCTIKSEKENYIINVIFIISETQI